MNRRRAINQLNFRLEFLSKVVAKRQWPHGKDLTDKVYNSVQAEHSALRLAIKILELAPDEMFFKARRESQSIYETTQGG